MAAYGALVSVMHIIDHILNYPRPPISLDKTQVESLTQKITFLQEFLEGYSQAAGYSKEADPLEMRIADAAYAAEDVIESHIADQVRAGSTNHDVREISSNINSSILPQSTTRDRKISFFNLCKCFRGPGEAATDQEDNVDLTHPDHEYEISPTDHQFYQSLQKVIEDMGSLQTEVMEIKEKTGVQDQLMGNSKPDRSLRSSSTGQNVTMVGFDDISVELMDKLTGRHCDRQIIQIVGMGGTGKTTLARYIYQHQVVVQHFDFCAWVTVSQEYRIREILLELLQVGGRNLDEHELGDQLHKRLSGRRYLIILDDIWDVEVCDHLKRFFPDNKNGSRVIVTTRISNFELIDSYVLKMGFLDMDKSWTLFTKIVFREEGCPLGLEEIGKRIVENCRGLPLSIVVVGGLLAKLEHTREYWESIAENLNSIVNSEDGESCLKILHMSYNKLPIYLKPCFLYMGVFSEDRKIRVSELIKLWVGEGFLKPISGRSFEDVAHEYLLELINRNLVLAHELGSIGDVKYCKIHDLLRDMCLSEAEKEKFYNVTRQRSHNVAQDTSTQRRYVVPKHTSKTEVRNALQNFSPARSIICDSHSHEALPLRNFQFLRVMSCKHYERMDFREDMFMIVNSRCLVLKDCLFSKFPSSFYPLWNLQTLIIGRAETEPFEIWSMTQLRHLECAPKLVLADLPSVKKDGIVLRNLQTLGRVENFNCCEEMVKRIPNIKKLKVRYEARESEEEWRDYGVNNLSHLHKLESLDCYQVDSRRVDYLQNITFPHSLRKLTLWTNFHWEDMFEQIGSLPLLEKFTFMYGKFEGNKWETTEGRFPNLKFLKIVWCRSLIYWKTESSHFPRLEHLVLEGVELLKEIPSEIGEITTLKKIHVKWSGDSAAISAKKIVEEQEELYGEVGLQVQVEDGDGYAFGP